MISSSEMFYKAVYRSIPGREGCTSASLPLEINKTIKEKEFQSKPIETDKEAVAYQATEGPAEKLKWNYIQSLASSFGD